MNSLQARLQLILSFSLLSLMALIWWLASSSITQITTNMMQSRLEHDAEALLASLQLSKQQQVTFKNAQLAPIYKRVYSGHYYVINTPNNQLRSHSLWDQNLPQKNLNIGEHLIEHTLGPNKQQLLQWTSAFKRFNQKIIITVAEDNEAINIALQQFNRFFALFCIAILIVLLLAQRYIIQRSLRPLNTIQKELQALSNGEIKALSQSVPTELQPLVNEVNYLLNLLKEQLKRSRNATGNLAHSLKHPLHLLLQLADDTEQPLPQKIRDELKKQTTQIHQLIERELKRAKMVGSGVSGQRFNPKKEIPQLIDVLKRVYHHKNIKITLNISIKDDFIADKNDMLELMGNLLDNAFKWSKQQVHCHFSQHNGITIKIEDDGIGCDEQQLSSLTERGKRIDELTQGTGLGLAIAKDVVELYHGTIHFKKSALGGLFIQVTLPKKT